MTKEGEITIQVPEAETTVQIRPDKKAAEDAGLNDAEIETAVKEGLVDEGKSESAGAGAVDGKKLEDSAATGDEKKELGAKKPGTSSETWELTSEDEAKLEEVAKANPRLKNVRGLYFARKREEAVRKQAEIALGKALDRIKELEETLAKGKEGVVVKKKESVSDDDPLKDLLNDGDDDPGKKPLTRAELEEALSTREKERDEEARKAADDKRSKAEQLKARLDEMDAEAQQEIPEYDELSALGEEILKRGKDVFDGDERTAYLAGLVAKEFLGAMSGALEIKKGDGRKTPTELLCELGRLHPKHKSGSAAKTTDTASGANAGRVERMLENAGKRSSANAGGGGGGGAISHVDLTLEELVRLPKSEFDKVPKSTIDKLLGKK